MQQNNLNVKQEDTNISAYKKLMQEIQKTLIQKYPKAVVKGKSGYFDLMDLEDLEKKMAEQNPTQNTTSSKGRGGNNVAENMKKSVLSIIRKRLYAEDYESYNKRYIKTYQLKSQKQNYILYFLFLHEFLSQRKITRQTLEAMKIDIYSRIQKYINNSQARIEEEPERAEFHLKNLNQFRKFLQIDLDFSKPRDYSEIRQWIKGQYLKKRAVYLEAQKKVRRIIQKHPLLKQIFSQMPMQIKKKTESSSEENSSSYESAVKQQDKSSS